MTGKKQRQESSSHGDLCPVSRNTACPVVTAVLDENGFQLAITDFAPGAPEIVANTDLYALFVKDTSVCELLDKYAEIVADLWLGDGERWSRCAHKLDSSELSSSLVERLQSKSKDTKVFITSKKVVPPEIRVASRRYVEALCDALSMSPGDKDTVQGAAEVFGLARLWHPSHEHGGSKLATDRLGKVLGRLSMLPMTARILGSLYRRPQEEGTDGPTLEWIGASIITIVDLLSESHGSAEPLSRSNLQVVGQGLQILSGHIVADRVVTACLKILEQEVEEQEAREGPSRVVVYSDKAHGVYALRTKLQAAEFEVAQPESLESLIGMCRRRPPTAIVMRLNALPLQVIKTLQIIISSGIPLGEVPAFLMVRSNVVNRLVSLLDMGIEDIVDIDGSMDMLITKIKKASARKDLSINEALASSEKGSTSGGRLSDMDLVDLLQALGPSRRTVRITIDSKSADTLPLVMCLDHGRLTYAKMGKIEGQDAVSEAMSWRDGTWQIEQVTFEDLPEPNNHTPNEAILMEGCRRLDESGRMAPAANSF